MDEVSPEMMARSMPAMLPVVYDVRVTNRDGITEFCAFATSSFEATNIALDCFGEDSRVSARAAFR